MNRIITSRPGLPLAEIKAQIKEALIGGNAPAIIESENLKSEVELTGSNLVQFSFIKNQALNGELDIPLETNDLFIAYGYRVGYRVKEVAKPANTVVATYPNTTDCPAAVVANVTDLNLLYNAFVKVEVGNTQYKTNGFPTQQCLFNPGTAGAIDGDSGFVECQPSILFSGKDTTDFSLVFKTTKGITLTSLIPTTKPLMAVLELRGILIKNAADAILANGQSLKAFIAERLN